MPDRATVTDMTMMPDSIPQYAVREVKFDERLIDLSMDVQMEMEQDQVHTFWSNIYLSRIPGVIREYINDDGIDVLDIRVLPTDYDIEAESVNVLLQAFWSYDYRPGIYHYGIYVTVHADGTLSDERHPNPMVYSRSMQPHVRNLFAHTALNYAPLQSSSWYTEE